MANRTLTYNMAIFTSFTYTYITLKRLQQCEKKKKEQ